MEHVQSERLERLPKYLSRADRACQCFERAEKGRSSSGRRPIVDSSHLVGCLAVEGIWESANLRSFISEMPNGTDACPEALTQWSLAMANGLGCPVACVTA